MGGVERDVQALIGRTASQVEQFRNARESVAKFQKQIRQVSGYDDIGASTASASSGTSSNRRTEDDVENNADPAAAAASAAFGLFGSILKAGAQGLREQAQKRSPPSD